MVAADELDELLECGEKISVEDLKLLISDLDMKQNEIDTKYPNYDVRKDVMLARKRRHNIYKDKGKRGRDYFKNSKRKFKTFSNRKVRNYHVFKQQGNSFKKVYDMYGVLF